MRPTAILIVVPFCLSACGPWYRADPKTGLLSGNGMTTSPADARSSLAPTSPSPVEPGGRQMSGNPPAAATPDAALAARLARFAPVEIRLDLSFLPASEQAALAHLVAAARLMDPIFLLQTWAGNPALAARLDGAAKSLFEIHGGPWDRIDEQPFVAVGGKPAGAGFYPEDLGKDEFDRYAAAHPDQADALKGLTTVVSRDASDRTRLVATPYSQAYREWLEPAARELEAAADATRNASLAKFCRSRAAAFRDDRYMQSDIDWMDLDSPLEATIGPYETYEDGLFGYKAAFEAFITVCDPAESKKLAIWKSELPAMEMNLPIPEEMKNKNRGSDSPIRLVDVVRTGGEARFGVQTIAFNLPNDETVREMKGSKKVLLRNFIRAKFDRMLRPIASRMLRADQVPLVTADAFTNQTLFHELSHGLGPGKIVVNGQPTEVRLALKELYSAIEEAKADVMGVYNLFFMMKKGLYPADQKNALGPTYLAGLFRSIRFGTADAHGKANAIQFNWMMKNGAISRDADGRYSIDFAKFESVTTDLCREICVLQGNGDYVGTLKLYDAYGTVGDELLGDLRRLENLPVDIKPEFASP